MNLKRRGRLLRAALLFYVLANNKLDTALLKADGHIRRQQALDLRPKGVQRERVSTICLPSTVFAAIISHLLR